MCGIFGFLGKTSKVDEKALRILAILNETRGGHSCGLLIDNKVIKYGKSISDVLPGIELSCKERLIGHTRQATSGRICPENSHPFVIGNIVGVHNGIIYNYKELNKELNTSYEVDSQLIFELLNRKGIEGLNELKGYFTVVWVDKRDKDNCLYIVLHNNDLALYKTNKGWIFTSDDRHMELAGVKGRRIELKQDVVYKITHNSIKELEKIIPQSFEYNYRDYLYTSGASSRMFSDICDICNVNDGVYSEFYGLYVCNDCKNQYELKEGGETYVR